MLRIKSYVADSTIPNAGRGLFTAEPIRRGEIIVFPNQTHRIYTRDELMSMPSDSEEFNSSIRWFDNAYTVDPEKSDIYFINHSFNPNCLWHLGFIFALDDIPTNTEITIDYRVLMDESAELEFRDSSTGISIRGFTWNEKMVATTRQLANLFEQLDSRQ